METFELPALSAGFPSPAELFAEHPLDVKRLLCLNPDATRFVRVVGPSMRDAHIFDGDVLVIDQSLAPLPGDIIVAQLAETFALRRYFLVEGHVILEAAHPRYPPLLITSALHFSCWGVVIFVISARHVLARRRLQPTRRS